ncbi:hypothetical protein DESC_240012 [Desulfosarcina cetonica]|nr:hypothetical protein DESC_240012 [Desulfosarcina cetonica]
MGAERFLNERITTRCFNKWPKAEVDKKRDACYIETQFCNSTVNCFYPRRVRVTEAKKQLPVFWGTVFRPQSIPVHAGDGFLPTVQ